MARTGTASGVWVQVILQENPLEQTFNTSVRAL
jgi:hypothetical protein